MNHDLQYKTIKHLFLFSRMFHTVDGQKILQQLIHHIAYNVSIISPSSQDFVFIDPPAFSPKTSLPFDATAPSVSRRPWILAFLVAITGDVTLDCVLIAEKCCSKTLNTKCRSNVKKRTEKWGCEIFEIGSFRTFLWIWWLKNSETSPKRTTKQQSLKMYS